MGQLDTRNGHDEKTNRKQFLKKQFSSVWFWCVFITVEVGFVLMAVAETHWQFEPGLSCIGPARPDRLSILGGQAFHIQYRNPVVDSQKVPAYFYGFGIVGLVYMFCVFPGNFHVYGYCLYTGVKTLAI